MRDLPDVQASKEGFPNIAIEKVGVRHIKCPFYYGDEKVLADFSIYCSLNEYTKGINMSRMAQSVFSWSGLVNSDSADKKIPRYKNLEDLALKVKQASKAADVYVKCFFDIPYLEVTPISRLYTWESCQITLETRILNELTSSFLTVKNVSMSLCPCSKEMSLLVNNISKDELNELKGLSVDLFNKVIKSGFGAHNQKSIIEIKVELGKKDFEGGLDLALALLAVDSSSCCLNSMLKRPDEKYITEVSYLGGYFDSNNHFVPMEGTGPKFVEDIARQVASKLNEKYLDKYISDYVVVVNNEESIHSGDVAATAVLSCGRSLK